MLLVTMLGGGCESGMPSAGASFVARQPIYDRELRVYGYELLFRDAAGATAESVGAERATSRTVVATLSELDLDLLVGGSLGFINVTERFVLGDYALLVPSERIALEVLETVDASTELVAKLAELARSGYMIVLDDFVYSDARRPLLELAHLVKLDVLAHTREQLSAEAGRLAGYRAKLLAKKVEDYETFEFCRELGFDLFQGYFFCRPKTTSAEGVQVSKLAKLQLIATLSDPDVAVEELEVIIGRDLGLSYRLLRLINSAFFGVRRRVESVRAAILLLGQRSVKNWSTLLVLADIDDRPSELAVTAMIRARFCELLARDGRADGDAAFTVGLFSVLDAFLDAPLERILAQLPLQDAVHAALLTHSGALGAVLADVLAYESGHFERLSQDPSRAAATRQHYLDALTWANDTARASGATTDS